MKISQDFSHLQSSDSLFYYVELALAFSSIMTHPTNDLHQELKQRPKYSTFNSAVIFPLLTSSMSQISVTQTSAMSFFMVRSIRPWFWTLCENFQLLTEFWIIHFSIRLWLTIFLKSRNISLSHLYKTVLETCFLKFRKCHKNGIYRSIFEQIARSEETSLYTCM